MMQRYQTFTRYRRVETLNAWRERELEWREAGTVYAAVSTASGSQQSLNDLLSIRSTHQAVTYDEVEAGDRIGEYTVDYVVPGCGRRMRQLYLSRTEERAATRQ